MFKNIVLSGGSIKTIYFLGGIKYLEELDKFKSILTFIGSSGGSVIAFWLALGFTSNEVLELCKKYNDLYAKTEFNVENLFSIFESFGIDDGSFFQEILRDSLFTRTGLSDITFIDFAKRTGKNLIICASDICKKKLECFSLETHPNLSVLTAVRASISIPLIFHPVRIDDSMYIDAGLFNNFPIEYIQKTNLKDTIGFAIDKEYNNLEPNKINFFTYLKMILDSTFYVINNKKSDELKNNIIIKVPDVFNDFISFDTNTMKFLCTNDRIQEYYDIGYDLTKKQLIGINFDKVN